MEENFEKKSSKKVWIIISVIILLLVAAAVAGVIYLKSSKKPEKIFAKAIEETFDMSENENDNVNARSGKIELELSAQIEADDPEIKAINEFLKAIKVKSTTEIDLDKKILNENLVAIYNNEEIISADALIQNETIYFYLNEIYSKYIEVNDYYLEGLDLSTIFENNTEVVSEDLVKDIKQILLDEVNSREFIQEKVEVNGEKVQKSTLRFTPREILEIAVKLMNKVNEYETIEGLEDLIEELEYAIEDAEDTENYAEISIYTKGLKNDVVKTDIVLINVEDDEAIIFEINKNSEKETVINLLMNEESAKVSGAEKLVELIITSEDKNKGTIEFKMNIEEYTAALKVKYVVDYNAKIEERDTSNSIMIDDITEADFMEMYENAQENEMLYSIIQLFITNSMESQVYDYEDEYDYLDDYDYDYLDDYDYDYLDDYDYDYFDEYEY